MSRWGFQPKNKKNLEMGFVKIRNTIFGSKN